MTRAGWDIGAGRWRLECRCFGEGDVSGYAPGTVVLSVAPLTIETQAFLAVWLAIPYATAVAPGRPHR